MKSCALGRHVITPNDDCVLYCILLRVYCHPCVMRSQISDRYSSAHANVLNYRLRTADREWSSRPRFCDGLTSVHHRMPTCFQMLHRVSEMERLFWTTRATGMDIRCGMRSGMSPYAMFIEKRNTRISKIYIRFSGSARYQIRNGKYWTTRGFYVIFGKGNENGQSGCFARSVS